MRLLILVMLLFATTPAYSGEPTLCRDWLGQWQDESINSSLSIRQSVPAGPLHIKGSARWIGGMDHGGNQIIHVGRFSGSSAICASHITVTDAAGEKDCVLDMTLSGGVIAVVEHNYCGGANVTFNGRYHRKP